MLELLFWFDSCVNALVRRIYWAWNNSLQWVQSILKVWNIRHSHYLTSDCQFHEARRWETDRMAPIFLFKTERTFPSLKEIWLTLVQTLFDRFCTCYLGAIHHFVQLNKLYILDTLLVADIACYWQNKTCGFVLPRSGKHSHWKSCHFGMYVAFPCRGQASPVPVPDSWQAPDRCCHIAAFLWTVVNYWHYNHKYILNCHNYNYGSINYNNIYL